MKILIYSFFTLLTFCFQLHAQQEIKLYKSGSIESNDIKVKESFISNDFLINISEPRMYYYAPAKNKN